MSRLNLTFGSVLYNVTVPTSQRAQSVKTSQSNLFREIIAICSENDSKHINTLCGQSAEFISGNGRCYI
jgi:hypothetical protein